VSAPVQARADSGHHDSIQTFEASNTMSTPPTAIRIGRLLLTGAAGNLGRQLRPRLKRYCDTLRLSDHAALVAPTPPAAA
jgi:hypothetical protein